MIPIIVFPIPRFHKFLGGVGFFFPLSSSYAPPLCLLTKLDEALILYKRKSGGPSSLVRRIIGGTREEDTRHFLGKMKAT